MAAKTKSVWERRARTAEKDLDTLRTEVVRLHAQLTEAQETAQTYAHRFHQMEDKNVELDAEVDRLKRTDTDLREEVRRLRKEAAEHKLERSALMGQRNYWENAYREEAERRAERREMERREMERRKTPQSQTPQTAPQTAPQTCRCSEHEERLRALLERVVSLESRMDAVSEASRLRRIFEGGG